MNDAEAFALDHDAELRRRWAAIRHRLASNSESLLSQGGLVSKTTSSGRRAWAVRFVDRSGEKPVHRKVFLGDDPRLIDLARRQIEYYRMLGGMGREVAGYARFATSVSFAVRRLAARPRGAKAKGRNAGPGGQGSPSGSGVSAGDEDRV